MARDASETRLRLMRAAEHLFARRGVDAVTVGEINRLAGQRNASAIHYHFGSRGGLVETLLAEHQADIAGERLDLCVALEDRPDAPLDDAVRAMAQPSRRKLGDARGRDFLRVASQFAHRAGVRSGEYTTSDDIARTIRLMERGLVGLVPGAIARERVAMSLQFIAVALGERAREIDDGEVLLLDEDTWTDNLVAMIVAALAAPTPPTDGADPHAARRRGPTATGA